MICLLCLLKYYVVDKDRPMTIEREDLEAGREDRGGGACLEEDGGEADLLIVGIFINF